MPPTPAPSPTIDSNIPVINSNVLVIKNKIYRILKVLGEGGSSIVYEAVDADRARVVAIKQVDLADKALAEGYLNEINILAKLQGEDTIIKLYDYHHDIKQKILYVVMEKGDTDLQSLCHFTPALIQHYWAEMLHAVNVIHKRGIIHSDLKPANFLLVKGRLKLIDFGIASSIESDIMTSVIKDTRIGTFDFIAPEAIQDLSGGGTDENKEVRPLLKIRFETDVWSLGCILYYFTYGKTPFCDIKITEMKFQAILNPNYQIPFPKNVDPKLLSVLKACLTRDVKLRPSIEELLRYPYVTDNVLPRGSPNHPQPRPQGILPSVEDPIPRIGEQYNLGRQSKRKRMDDEQARNLEGPPVKIRHPGDAREQKQQRFEPKISDPPKVAARNPGKKAATPEFKKPPAATKNKKDKYSAEGYDNQKLSHHKKKDVPVAKSKSGESVSCVEERMPMPDNSTHIVPFFADLKFELAGFPKRTKKEYIVWITEVGGEVMSSDYKGVVDYLITPVKVMGRVYHPKERLKYLPEDVSAALAHVRRGGQGKLKYKEHLTSYWIDDCLDAAEMLPKQYYHYPVKIIPDSAPLQGCVTSISGYSGTECDFIQTVIELLGGKPQVMFSRKDNKDKEIIASTHLVCNAPEGPKYKAALRWGIPVIHKDWMRACLKEWKWICELPFLIGDSKIFSIGTPLPSVPLDDETYTVEEDEIIRLVHQIWLRGVNNSECTH